MAWTAEITDAAPQPQEPLWVSPNGKNNAW
jgi:hypothetical protein